MNLYTVNAVQFMINFPIFNRSLGFGLFIGWSSVYSSSRQQICVRDSSLLNVKKTHWK